MMLSREDRLKIVDIAKKYLGQTELSGNSGFVDKVFEQRMKEAGWLKGQAWCCYAMEIIYKEFYKTFDEEIYDEIDLLFSGSTLKTLQNFTEADWEISQLPKYGAIAIWQLGKTWSGHAGIVSLPMSTEGWFKSIEGNTSVKPEDREGYIVAEKKHSLNLPFNMHGLNLKGFILPKE